MTRMARSILVPWRRLGRDTVISFILATLAARADLLAGFTAERDMGTEGAGSADSAVRDAIDKGLIPGPCLRVSGNAISVLGGHEDALHYNPEQHVLSNATYANTGVDIEQARGMENDRVRVCGNLRQQARPEPDTGDQ